jgi:hypothetical protein
MDGGDTVTDEFKHYGIRRQSGRYPWGSGEDDYQRSKDFYNYVNALRDQVIADGTPAKNADRVVAQLIGQGTGDQGGYSVADLRDTRTIAKETIVRQQVVQANKLKAKDWSIEAIAQNLGIPAPTVRLRLKTREEDIKASLSKTADILRKNVDDHDIVDIGRGVALQMGLSNERLRAAASLLRDEGYQTYTIPQPQVGTQQFTNQLVMVKPGTSFGDARRMADRVHTMGDWTEDEGKTFFGIHTPLNVNVKRIEVKYDSPEDGTVYVRPGVKDLDMGKNSYAQVRVAVNGTHFIKGMAVLKDDLPPGVDLQVHSNKKRGTPVLGDGSNSVLKVMKDDPDNPFGSAIKKQIVDIDPKTGKEVLKSALNLVNEEGDWDDWRLSAPSQFLAKQPHGLIKSQLNETRTQVKARIDEINKITNPVVRKKKLEDYADQIDADAVDLRAASLPRQRTQVLIPVKNMSENEVYAPNFNTGEPVVLIRYPHGGRFEIPELIVNNNQRAAKKLIGNAPDAIGISPKVAEKLSGADFDGDTAIVIPNPKGAIKGIKTTEHFYQKAFDGFNPKEEYGGYEVVGTKTKKDGTVEDIGNFKLMKSTGLEMGMITNLVTDMSIQGAKPEHVVRAVKHSMVVIDAEKHKLDYRRSADEQGIAQLKELYQGSAKSGAKTLLSQATATVNVPQTKLRPAGQGGAIDKETGAIVRVPTGKANNKYDPKTRTYLDGKDGRPLVLSPKMDSPKRLAITDDAYTLVRDKNDPVERMYADHANAMKTVANSVRLQSDRIQSPLINKDAKKVYKAEIDQLTADLKAAQALKPLERRAQQYAAVHVRLKRQEDPTLYLDRDRKKKVEKQALAGARARLGLEKQVIPISDSQWDAIQARAISASKLRDILQYADPKRIEELAIPRQNTVMTSAVSARAKAMLAAGATNAEIAASLGIPQSTLRAAAVRGDL